MIDASKSLLLRIRPSLPDPDDKSKVSRGPIMMESAISALHYLTGDQAEINFELGYYNSKISFYVRSNKAVSGLIESQLYAQYPDIDIEPVGNDIFTSGEGEVVVYTDLRLTDPEVYPIKRHPQFDDMLARQNIDTMAGITSTLVRYPEIGMRGHIQVSFEPIEGKYRKRVRKFLPLLTRGLAKKSTWYAKVFTSVHLARGWRWWAYLPLNILMGGFRAWFSFVPSAGDLLSESMSAKNDAEDSHVDSEFSMVGKRSHEREDSVAGIADKINRLLFGANVRLSVIAKAGSVEAATHKLQEMVSSFRQFSLPQSNGFKMAKIETAAQIPMGIKLRPYVLSVEELATLWHFPNALVKTPNIDWVTSKKLEPPVELPLIENEKELTVLGEAVFRGGRHRFGIRPDDRRRHMYIIGKTGMGKSTILENMIFSDIQSGKGVAVIDPHGDLVEACLRYIPASRSNDVILFDPADKMYPLSFNMLHCTNPDQVELIASGMMAVFTKLWPDVWSGRMENILRNALLALIETQGNSMLGILRMFTDDAYRKKVVDHTTNHVVKSFWEDEYAAWSEKYRTEAIAAIQNKIGQLLSVPLIRNIVGQTTNKLNVREAMDTGKIILVNLSKGNLGEDNSAFLGSMLVTKFQLDAMSRADIPEKERKDFFLYVDEFQNFATESFATILSEARKYRLSLTLANQYIGQLLIGDKSTVLQDAIFGNVGSMVSFQVGSDDAEVLAMQLEEMVQPKDILSLPKYHAYMRLMINGMASKPFSVSTLAPPKFEQDAGRVEKIRALSRERYTEGRAEVEDKISKWMASAKEGRVAVVKVEKQKEKEKEEMEKARKKGMKLADYRAWRDREMWINDFNMIRKKEFLGEAISADEKAKMKELSEKLEKTGGIPPPSKAMMDMKDKKEGKTGESAKSQIAKPETNSKIQDTNSKKSQ